MNSSVQPRVRRLRPGRAVAFKPGPENKRRDCPASVDSYMPKPFPLEFRRDVVAVARKGEALLSQIARDFGISESCLHRWLKIADVDDGRRPGVTSTESAELRELRKRNKVLETENEILRRAAAYFAREISPQ
jgi:transposase